ncbi:MAG: aminotransferase class V-fold PLP-dependent enzyme [Bacteroidetes bacterium]|nr:aminotransferase class V-fold PLP-dependent enzyme [Bacteroidota bacterium]
MIPFNTAFPLDRVRADTPACSQVIHLNNAGASLPPQLVTDSLVQFLQNEAQQGGYEYADRMAAEISGFYAAVARLLQAQARNIAYAGSATDAYARALSAIPFQAGDVILTSTNDYSSNQIAFMALEKRLGIKFVRARDLESGGVDPESVARCIQKYRPKLVAITHIPTNSGLIQDVESIGALCREAGIWYLVDACQSAGHLPLDVNRIGCDFLTGTLRKYLRGPRGMGFLYASDRVLAAGLEMMLPDMRGAIWDSADTYQSLPDARRFEYWEMSQALILGSKVAVEYALELGLEAISARLIALASYTRHILAEIPGIQVLDEGKNLCGIVTAYNPKWQSDVLMQNLQKAGIQCRISPMIAGRIDFERKAVPWALRITPHYFNTSEELDQLALVCKQY